jgi:hypothetical protein
MSTIRGYEPRAGSRSVRNEDGTSLVELLVSMMILAIALSMTLAIVHTVTNQSYGTYRAGASTDTAQDALATLDNFLRDAVTPSAVDTLTGSAAACWGSTDVDGNAPGSSLGIMIAYDYEIMFCGYVPGSSNTTEYEIDLTACQSVTNGGYCTLQVVNLGTCTTVPISGCGTTVVFTIPGVWCDTSCQNDIVSESTSCPSPIEDNSDNHTPPLFQYWTEGTTPALLGCQASTTQLLDAQSETGGSELAEIQNITVNFTVMSSANLSTPVAETSGSPGTQVSDQIYLANLPAT